WTNNRWIITLSKSKGQLSQREKELNLKKEMIENVKKSEIYKNLLAKFPDLELLDVHTIEKKND
ncbi:DNA polymerase III, subunit gamma and tau, partial [Candidatus Pelagibacter bacterium]|nr:DNA polymerase III, subunit gamma and tau [Candidatus Pelagibacter bacterium]